MTAPPCSSILSSSRRRDTPKAGGGGVRPEPPRPLRGHPSSREEGKAGICARSRRRHLALESELDHLPRHGLGLLHVREMARLGDLLEFRSGNGRAEAPAVSERREAVVRPPKKKRRNPDAVQTRPELRVVHVGAPAEVAGGPAVGGL